jgi:hypothetical protein
VVPIEMPISRFSYVIGLRLSDKPRQTSDILIATDRTVSKYRTRNNYRTAWCLCPCPVAMSMYVSISVFMDLSISMCMQARSVACSEDSHCIIYSILQETIQSSSKYQPVLCSHPSPPPQPRIFGRRKR